MRYVSGADRFQIDLFPDTLEDYVDEYNICRIIDAFVDSLDLVALGFAHSILSPTGRPPYNPAVLLKLYIYGMLNRVRSSRRLETEARRNVELMWLLCKQTPDDRTICNFRKDNADVLYKVFREFNKFCLKADLFGRETVAIDGSKFRANNNRKNIFTRSNVNKGIAEIEKQLNIKIAEYLEELDKNDAQDSTEKVNESAVADLIRKLNTSKEELQNIIAEMDKNGEDQFSKNDPDSRLMVPGGDGREFDARYNVQTAVDVENSLIVDFDVTNNANDLGQLKNMSDRAKEVLEVDEINSLGDKGYYSGDDIVDCENENITCFVAKPGAAGSNHKVLRLDKFIYDKLTDSYTCPMKQILEFTHYETVNGEPLKTYTNRTACMNCLLRGECSKSGLGKKIIREQNQDILDEVNKRTAENKELYKKRGETVEHPFGTIKSVWGYRGFLCRGFEMVRAEMSLTCLAYNFRRAFNIFKEKGTKMCFGG
jgi:transposase